MSQLSVRHSRRYGIVADHILENKELSLGARAVAAWLAGRQDGFSIRVEAMCKRFLGIGEKQWKSVRKELEMVGWWRSTRSPSGERGRFVWFHEFCDEGFGGVDGETTIPPLSTDGQSMDARSTHAHGGGNHNEVSTNKNLTTTTPNPSSKTKPEVGGGGGGEDIDRLIDAACWQQSQVEAIRNKAGFRTKLRTRMESQGVSEDDRDTLKRWEQFLKRQDEAQRLAKAASEVAAAKPVKEGAEARLNASKALALLKKRPLHAA
jgi:hypothetical protein